MLRLTAVDLARHRVRTALTASGIAIAVATIVALLSLSAGIERAGAGLIHLGGSELGLFQGGVGDLTASALPQSLVPRVRQVAGVRDAAPIAVATGEAPGRSSFLVFGVQPATFVVRRLVFAAGRAAAGPNEVALGDVAAADLHLGIGDSLPLGDGTFRVVGIYHAGVPFEDQGAALQLPVVQHMLGRSGDVTTIGVQLAPGARASEVGARLERSFKGTVAISEPGQVERVDTNSLLVRKAAVVFAALALLVGGIAIANTMLMAVFERREEFALLLAVGWPRRLVGALVLQEGVIVSLVGALVGLGLGAVAGELLVRVFSVSSLVSPHVTAWALGRAMLVALATGALGSLYPAWWITRLRLSEALG